MVSHGNLAPCKAVSAFAPPMNTQDFNLNNKVVEAKYTSYEEGMATGKPLTGSRAYDENIDKYLDFLNEGTCIV